MKKILLVIAFTIILSINSFAQYKPFQFGLNVSPGLNMTSSKLEGIIETENYFSFNWGFIGNFYFVENYGFSTGFNIMNQKGGYNHLETSDTLMVPQHCKIESQYLEIPLSLIMRTERFNDFRIFSNIGYGLGIRLDSDGSLLNDELSKIRHGLILKLGVEYNVYKSSCLTVAVKYNDNFANIYKKHNSLQHNIMLNSLCLEIGFMF
jgi:hypothetical protein